MYVSKPKEHGLGQQTEGYYEQGQPTVVIEDLVSTGKSSLQVVDILKQAGLHVIGLVSIFGYGFEVANAVPLKRRVYPTGPCPITPP